MVWTSRKMLAVVLVLTLELRAFYCQDYSRMVMDIAKENLYVSGKNAVYHFNATDLEELGSLTLEPNNGTLDKDVFLMEFTSGTSSQPAVVTFCVTQSYQCFTILSDDISNIVENRTKITSQNAAALFVPETNTWFVACPYQEHYDQRESICSSPGIFGANDLTKGFSPSLSVRFEKNGVDANSQMTEYIAGFSFNNLRIFFGIQGSSEKTSHVSQICQASDLRKTYIDMPIKCGTDTILTDVKVEASMFVASFTNMDRRGSSVCVYSLNNTLERFVDNKKKCFVGEYDYKLPTDYINENPRCKSKNTALLNQSREEILCEPFGIYFGVIGNLSLEAVPALRYNHRVISAITLDKRHDYIVAFFGSEDYISKAVIDLPTKSAKKLETGFMLNEQLQKGLENDGTSLFALTASRIHKFPPSQCHNRSCEECLADKDPDCGWCVIGNICSTSLECPDEHVWLHAKTASACPKISRIDPDIINVKDPIQSLDIQITPDIKFTNLSPKCLYESDQDGLLVSKTVDASQNTGITCLEPYQDVRDQMDQIKGTLVVNVSVLVSTSDDPLVTAQITYYKCDTFNRCMDCVNTNWSCNWCLYANRCVDNGTDCESTPNTAVSSVNECPTSTSFTFSEDVSDDNGTFTLTQDEYSIVIWGSNFPQPRPDFGYSCGVRLQEMMFSPAKFLNTSAIQCNISLTSQSLQNGTVQTQLLLKFGETYVDGTTQTVLFYDCETLISPSENCGECVSFQYYKPHFKCHWCRGQCRYRKEPCQDVVSCPPPTITKVWPMSAAINSTTVVDIFGFNLGSHFNDTMNSVTVAGLPCTSINQSYIPSKRISCSLGPSFEAKSGQIKVDMVDGAVPVLPAKKFYFKEPQITSVCPEFGPMSGGTNLTIIGIDLNTGRHQNVSLSWMKCKRTNCSNAYQSCKKISRGSERLCCSTSASNMTNRPLRVDLQFDGWSVSSDAVNYTYSLDPVIKSISPRDSFMIGGRTLTITGQNLFAVQEPKIYLKNGNRRISHPCRKNETVNRPGEQKIYCPSPELKHSNHRMRRQEQGLSKAVISFEMDGVESVADLNKSVATITYHPNPIIKMFKHPEPFQKIIIIEGENLNAAASKEDVTVLYCTTSQQAYCMKCNVTLFEREKIYFNPPTELPFNMTHCTSECFFPVKVRIGYLQITVGSIKYGKTEITDSNGSILAAAVSACIFIVLVLIVVVLVLVRKRKTMRKERKSLVYKMEKKEAKFREHCRKEFAGLQTAMSDLTSDLSGGNVLFRDYNVYASSVIFTSDRDHAIMKPPPVTTEYSSQAMESLRGLLRNTQFLLMLVRTLDKEKQFTIKDKSNVASILMVLSHDNMEYITGILKTLLGDLVDKNIGANTPKLLLRRSECVAEKLLTHWLSICLYHYLKERAGSPLFILYKAIKIQVERGPVDYISNCAKFTLSEDKLLGEDINPKSLTLQVTHEDLLANEVKTVSVSVLECDTITQTKSKVIEVFYKNVGYSQRPSVHSTNIEWLQGDSTARLLSDEDPNSQKDGIWKRINTLQYYGVEDGAKMQLVHFRREQANFLGNPDSYIGSFKRTKQVTKHYQGDNDGEVKIASDILLPRLLVTKGTLQSYVDDLLSEILCTTSDPPIIVKYLFDFLDTAAEDREITDPEVLHTWKCNSLLLRFWVNIMKNPEFVFDIFKPHNVDKCLSVVAQAFMDSCSTVDASLGMGSPSNKLLFAKDIPRYKTLVREYFQHVKDQPAISDQDLNSYLTEKVSMKFSGNFHQSSALMEMYKYMSTYRNAILNELDNMEAESPGQFSPMTSKLQLVFMMMDREGDKAK